ncbi:hypothetical protein AB0P17_20370 [Streptomyces sp. NPDC088124]|uniref:hypothetical protein n=1 Tax=Streptomyces sp. NPDC088124 TaxID=3154654 RepID=UPI00342CD607
MSPHHHAYLWHGHGTLLVTPGDAHRRPGHPEFPTTPLMPLEPAHWLLKTPTHIQATFSQAQTEDAARWYAHQLQQHADILTGTYAPTADLTRRLTARADITGGWWTTGGRFLSLNLIACDPHPQRPHHDCPAPQR